jgi:hypothetical protein
MDAFVAMTLVAVGLITQGVLVPVHVSLPCLVPRPPFDWSAWRA